MLPWSSFRQMAAAGFDLFCQRCTWHKPVRALTIRGINLLPINQPLQLELFNDAEHREKRRMLDNCVDDLRSRFGYGTICAASLRGENTLAQDKCELVVMPGMMYR